jgi:hypothetical protein
MVMIMMPMLYLGIGCLFHGDDHDDGNVHELLG